MAEIVKTAIKIGDDPDFKLCDTILEADGGLWLVGSWLVSPDGKQQRPARALLMSELPYLLAPDGSPAKFVLVDPLPAGLLDGTVAPSDPAKYPLIEMPDIVMDVRSIH